MRDRPEPGGDYASQRNGFWCQLSAAACSRWRGPAARPTGGLWIDLLALDREGGMNWRVMIELVGAEGTVQLHEVSAGGSTTAECSAETLGLTVAEGKMTLRAAAPPGPRTGRGALPAPASL